MKDIEKLINEAKNLVDKLLGEAEQNEIPEVPENKKNAGKAVKKEIEGKSNGDSSAVLSKGEPIGEHEDNIMPEVPDTSKTSGAAIKKAVANSINPKVEQPIKTQPAKIDNELPDGVTPDSVQTSGKKMKKDIAEAINNILCKKKSLNEGEYKLHLDDFEDYLFDLRKKGFTDEKKLQGMFDRAKEIAKSQGKEEDRKVILGIFQSFFKAV